MVKIESDGTKQGTRLVVDGKVVDDASEITFYRNEDLDDIICQVKRKNGIEEIY